MDCFYSGIAPKFTTAMDEDVTKLGGHEIGITPMYTVSMSNK